MSEPYWSALAGGFVDYIGPWAAGTTYAPGAVVSYNGINYLAVNPSTGVVPAGGIASDIGIALPGSPFDGQEFTLVDSLTAPTYAWKFRYMAAKATNKWVFVGGSPIYAVVDAFETRNVTAYGNLGTVGPAIAVPVAGDYFIDLGFRRANDGFNDISYMSFDIGATAAVDADATIQEFGGATAQNMRRQKKVGLTAVTLTAKYRKSVANVSSFGNRWMSLQPIAVGG